MGMGPWKAEVVSGGSGVAGINVAAGESAVEAVLGAAVAWEPQADSINSTTASKAAQTSRRLTVWPLPGGFLS